MKKNILVTGGAGYIGSHTILQLIRKGFFPISVDNLLNARIETYSRIQEITNVEVPHFEVDLCDKASLQNVFSTFKIDAVIHFAARKLVPESIGMPLEYMQNNLIGQLNLIECCKNNSVSCFIFSSSCAVYGEVTDLPVKETTAWKTPTSPYGLTKQMGEQILESVACQMPFKSVLLRYFNPVGADLSGKLGEYPLQKPSNLVPYITQAAAGWLPPLTVFGTDYETRDGTCIRDYVHVLDLADAHISALEAVFNGTITNKTEPFNIGTGNGVTVWEAIRAFEKAAGFPLPLVIGERRAGDVPSVYSDSTKAKQILQWEPKYDIDVMMATAWAWQKNLIQ